MSGRGEVLTLPGVDREYAQLVKDTVAKNATPEELRQFLYLCNTYGLDPLTKELVFSKYTNKEGKTFVSFITTRDGYLKAAMRDPNFAGLQSMPVKEGDNFEVCLSDPGKPVRHTFGVKRGRLLGAYAIAQHKSRPPVVFWADFEEYFRANSSNNAWQQYPSAMIQKVAEVGALRRQFNISGLVAREEIGDGEPDTPPAKPFSPSLPLASASNPPSAGQEPAKLDWTSFWVTVAKYLQMDKDQVLQWASKWKGQDVGNLTEIIKTPEEMEAFLAYLRQAKAEPEQPPQAETAQGTEAVQGAVQGAENADAAEAVSNPQDVYLIGPVRYEPAPPNGGIPHIKIMLLKPNGERVPVMALQGEGMEKFERLGLGEGGRVVARLAKLPKSQYYRLEDVEVAS